MRVLQIVTKSEHGGAQTHVWQLSTYLREKGHAVHIMAAPGGWLQEQARSHSIDFHPNGALSNSFSPVRGLRAERAITELAQQIRPDVVHCHSSAAGFWTRLGLRGSIPTVFTVHGWGFMPGAPLPRRIVLLAAEKLVGRFTTRYICVSERDGRLAARYGIAPPSRIAVIHNGIEPHEAAAVSSYGGPVRLIFVGRIARPKEPDILLAALTELPAGLRDAYELQVVGDGPLLPRLRKLASNSAARVRLAGALDRDEVMKLLLQAQIFVLISRYEGFPISILEAMSMGLAIIASDVGGVPEAVTPACGILIPPGDKEALKQALTRLAEDRAAIGRYGAAARERVGREFSLTAMCDRTIAVYEGVLAP